MDQITGGQWFCIIVVALIVLGAGITAWAKAFAARKTGVWPTDGDE